MKDQFQNPIKATVPKSLQMVYCLLVQEKEFSKRR